MDIFRRVLIASMSSAEKDGAPFNNFVHRLCTIVPGGDPGQMADELLLLPRVHSEVGFPLLQVVVFGDFQGQHLVRNFGHQRQMER